MKFKRAECVKEFDTVPLLLKLAALVFERISLAIAGVEPVVL